MHTADDSFMLLKTYLYCWSLTHAVKVYQLALTGLSWLQLVSSYFNWPQLASIGLNWLQLASANLSWLQLTSDGLNLPQLASPGFNWHQLSSADLSWSQLASADLNWTWLASAILNLDQLTSTGISQPKMDTTGLSMNDSSTSTMSYEFHLRALSPTPGTWVCPQSDLRTLSPISELSVTFQSSESHPWALSHTSESESQLRFRSPTFTCHNWPQLAQT